jgi:hypothetical protein
MVEEGEGKIVGPVAGKTQIRRAMRRSISVHSESTKGKKMPQGEHARLP